MYVIAEKTGWTKREILYNNSFASLNLMLADAPKLTKNKKEKEAFADDDELKAWLMK